VAIVNALQLEAASPFPL